MTSNKCVWYLMPACKCQEKYVLNSLRGCVKATYKKMHIKLSVKNDLFWNKCFILQLKSNGVLSIKIVYKYRRIWHE